MDIAHVHESMRVEISTQGPLVDKATGRSLRSNRGVARRWRLIKRQEAEARNALTAPERRRASRRRAA